ncbi:MAG TPA: hypothetical protein VNG31_03000 [Candidatus Baltobacteraceae bacterium]|nr:hypothetical protein [Candidatus Baltobacteraceae bacterium]
MRPTDPEPPPQELEALLTDEERRVLDGPDVPEDVKTEIFERLERRRTAELEGLAPDEPLEL